MGVNLPEKCGFVLRGIFNFSANFLKLKFCLLLYSCQAFYSAAPLLAFARLVYCCVYCAACVVTFNVIVYKVS